MGIIQNLLAKVRKKKEQQEDYVRQQRIEEDYARKKLNSNERELQRFKEEARQQRVKAELQRHRKNRNDEIWRGKKGNPLYARNITKAPDVINGHELFKNNKNIFSHQKNVIKRKGKYSNPLRIR